MIYLELSNGFHKIDPYICSKFVADDITFYVLKYNDNKKLCECLLIKENGNFVTYPFNTDKKYKMLNIISGLLESEKIDLSVLPETIYLAKEIKKDEEIVEEKDNKKYVVYDGETGKALAFTHTKDNTLVRENDEYNQQLSKYIRSVLNYINVIPGYFDTTGLSEKYNLIDNQSSYICFCNNGLKFEQFSNTSVIELESIGSMNFEELFFYTVTTDDIDVSLDGEIINCRYYDDPMFL